jgi:hypothetical protein
VSVTNGSLDAGRSLLFVTLAEILDRSAPALESPSTSRFESGRTVRRRYHHPDPLRAQVLPGLQQELHDLSADLSPCRSMFAVSVTNDKLSARRRLMFVALTDILDRSFTGGSSW